VKTRDVPWILLPTNLRELQEYFGGINQKIVFLSVVPTSHDLKKTRQQCEDCRNDRESATQSTLKKNKSNKRNICFILPV